MATFTLTPNQITAIASLHAATPPKASDRLITPILTTIHVTVTPGEVSAVATDRYIVTHLAFPLGAYAHTLDTEPLVFAVDSKDWQALAKAIGTTLGYVAITVDSDRVTAAWDHGHLIGQYLTVTGNYPPGQRLFPDVVVPLDTMPYFTPDKLTRAMKATHPDATSAKARADVIWSLGVGETHTTRKHAPLVLTAHTPAGVVLRSLVQPNTPVNP